MHLRAANKGVGLATKLLLAFVSALLIPGVLRAAIRTVDFDVLFNIGMQTERGWNQVTAQGRV